MYGVHHHLFDLLICAGIEEEYQTCARQREEKEEVLNDARAELDSLISDVEHITKRLSELEREEENAKIVASSHPDTISQLREKIECSLRILTSSPPPVILTATTTAAERSEGASVTGEPAPPEAVENMDTSQ